MILKSLIAILKGIYDHGLWEAITNRAEGDPPWHRRSRPANGRVTVEMPLLCWR